MTGAETPPAAYGIYIDKYKAARRVNFLIGKDGKILEEQIDKSAIDPTKIVDACERPSEKLTPRPVCDGCYDEFAGWSSLVARWAHNPKVGGSNPPPATNAIIELRAIGHLQQLSKTVQ